MRARIVAAVIGVGLAACGGPYKGKPEKVNKVKVTEEPPEPEGGTTVAEIKWIDDCEGGGFTDDPNKAKKKVSEASGFVSNGDDEIAASKIESDDNAKAGKIVSAIELYKKALLANHYDPEATYKLAVAYAQVRRKGCALKMLKRLGKLTDNPRLAGGGARLEGFLEQVESEPAFKPFKNEAMKEIGR
jgi:hypothetical protein